MFEIVTKTERERERGVKVGFELASSFFDVIRLSCDENKEFQLCSIYYVHFSTLVSVDIFFAVDSSRAVAQSNLQRSVTEERNRYDDFRFERSTTPFSSPSPSIPCLSRNTQIQ